MKSSQEIENVVRLFSLALRLEGEGQYNLAKITRARADALTRQAAWQLNLSSENTGLVREIEELAGLLDDPGLEKAFQVGASALASGRLPLIEEIPDPYVCRTCGFLALAAVPEKCPRCGAWGRTFQWFPPVYWLEALDPSDALQELRQTPRKVAALLDGLSEEALIRPGEDGGWSIRNVVSHLRDAQGVIAQRVDLFLKEENPFLASKAVFSWAADEHARPPSTREILDTYISSREEMADLLDAIPFADWWRTGTHEEFGVVSIKQQVSYFTLHELTHLPQIERMKEFQEKSRD